jgi:predicted membrane channel-forming protein YqfA (hemolysin III family)
VKWLLRFLLWATLLSVPCFFVSHAWQRGLARVAMAVLALVGQGVEIEDVQVMAPFDLAIFVAMCLASVAAPWAVRRRALLIGLPALAAVEALTVVAGIGVNLLWPEGSPQLDTGMRLTSNVIETVPWVSAAVVWLLLLGAWELRLPVPARQKSARAEKLKRPDGGGGA